MVLFFNYNIRLVTWFPDYGYKEHLPGQPFVLHAVVSSDGPRLEQSFPPCCGAGLLQLLLRAFRPPPQETEQSLQLFQLP